MLESRSRQLSRCSWWLGGRRYSFTRPFESLSVRGVWAEQPARAGITRPSPSTKLRGGLLLHLGCGGCLSGDATGAGVRRFRRFRRRLHTSVLSKACGPTCRQGVPGWRSHVHGSWLSHVAPSAALPASSSSICTPLPLWQSPCDGLAEPS